jgi:hypothetical protein
MVTTASSEKPAPLKRTTCPPRVDPRAGSIATTVTGCSNANADSSRASAPSTSRNTTSTTPAGWAGVVA